MIYDILPINNYKGNNSSTTFDFDFYIDNKNQLNVYHFDENKIKRLLKLDIDYSINEIKNKIRNVIAKIEIVFVFSYFGVYFFLK